MAKSICFVGLDAYPVLNPDYNNQYFGGESVQHTLLARAFVKAGYDVSLISLDYGQPDGQLIDGITVYKTYSAKSGIPLVRFLHPRLSSIINALRKSDADIYYQSCAGMLTGVTAWFCKRKKRKFIFRVAHDNDCIPDQLIVPNRRDKLIYEYGLKLADIVAAQGATQIELLKQNYNVDSVLVNMAVEQIDVDKTSYEKDIDVLWVNNLREIKRPDLVTKLASYLPEVNFTVIGGAVPGNEDLYAKMEGQASQLANLKFLGAVPYHEVNNYFSRARVFVNTSDSEGFPNSFLQAWIRGIPVVSFFDPDKLIQSKCLGVVPNNLSDMAGVINQLLSSDSALKEFEKTCSDFAERRFGSAAVVREYERLMLSIAS